MSQRPNAGPRSRRANKGGTAAQQRPVGKMGRSQAVTTFGVGSVYELRTFRNGKATLHSVMVAGLEAWEKFKYDMKSIREDILARILGVNYFLLPPSEPERAWDPTYAVIPAVRFPGVLSCDKCERVGRIGREFMDPGFGGVKCNAQGCSGRGVPFRFVVACYDKKDLNQPGHIDDFPFERWAHPERICNAPAVYIEAGKNTTGLGGMVLKCRGCKASGQSMERVFFPGALGGLPCSGRRPWLHDREENCKRPLQVLQRGASNTYFPITASALSIPPYSDRLFMLVDRALSVAVAGALKKGSLTSDAAVSICRGIAGLDDPDVFSDVQLKEAIEIRSGMTALKLPSSEAEQRQQERNAIVQGRPETSDASDFVSVPIEEFELFPVLSTYFDRVVQVHRLREVRALRGFHRVESSSGGDAYSIDVAPLSKRPLDWLPAIEVRGEGIYLELKRDLVLHWQDRPSVKSRHSILAENLRRVCIENQRTEDAPSVQDVLIHTFSHLLMKQLSLECGYSGSSLRERIYTVDGDGGNGYAGILIYTASAAADGTLGGLVSQGEPERLQGMVRSALQSARWCSSDPLCSESTGQGVDALNLSACHACALIGETSCERRNLYLDRGFVTGTIDFPDTGFFGALLPALD